jgi:hypothetical protein
VFWNIKDPIVLQFFFFHVECWRAGGDWKRYLIECEKCFTFSCVHITRKALVSPINHSCNLLICQFSLCIIKNQTVSWMRGERWSEMK